MNKVTAQDIENYQKCSRKVWLKYFEVDCVPEESSGFLEYLSELGIRFERECVETLDSYSEPKDYEETISLMKTGVKYIYQGVLEDETRVGRVDLLRRDDSKKSVFGEYSYDIIDIKSATLYSELEKSDPEKYLKKRKELQKSYGLQLWHYGELLCDVLGSESDLYLWVKDRVGFTEVRIEESILASFKSRESISKVYSDTINGIDSLSKFDEVLPFKCSACGQCEWNSFCMSKLEEASHCSLIAGVQKRGLNDLNALGISTISDFYTTIEVDTKIKYVLTGGDTAKFTRLKTQAQALLEDKEFYLGEPLKPFDVDYLLFYDIEGEMGHEFEYLHGVWEVNQRTGAKRYVSFISSNKFDESSLWYSFLSYVKDISLKGSFKIIYFADYERIAWKNLSSSYGTSTEDLELLMNNSIDILKEWITNKLILPRYNYSIKTVAPYYGFSWKCKENVYIDENGREFTLSEANGSESIAWLDYWLSGKEYYKDIILDYNKDDCIATEFVYFEMLERFG